MTATEPHAIEDGPDTPVVDDRSKQPITTDEIEAELERRGHVGTAGDGLGSGAVVTEVDFVDRKHPEGNVHKTAVSTARWKCIRDETSGRIELYDLTADPDELRDLYGEHGAEIAKLLGVIDGHFERLAAGALEAVDTTLSEEVPRTMRWPT